MILKTILAFTLSYSTLASADLSGNAQLYKGQYAFDLIQRPEIVNMLKSAGGGAYNSVLDNSTASPSEVTNGRFLVFSGCRPHACNQYGYIAVVDLKKEALLIVRTAQDFPGDKVIVIQESSEAWLTANHSLATLPMNITRELMEFARFDRNY